MTKTESLIIAGAIVAVAAVVVYYEISDHKTEHITPKPIPENCITISRDDIVNNWLSPGWNKPGDPNYISAIIFEPISASPMVVVAYPVDINCTPLEGKKLNMTITNPTDSDCSFPAGLSLGRVRYDFVPEDADAWGDLIYFNFLRIIPQIDPTDPTKLGFNVQFIKNDVSLIRVDTKPCPPYCPVQ